MAFGYDDYFIQGWYGHRTFFTQGSLCDRRPHDEKDDGRGYAIRGFAHEIYTRFQFRTQLVAYESLFPRDFKGVQ